MPKITTKNLFVRGKSFPGWTPLPVAGQPVYPVSKAEDMVKPVGRDIYGRLWVRDVRIGYYPDTGELVIGDDGTPVVGGPTLESEIKIINGRALCDNKARDMARAAYEKTGSGSIEGGFAAFEIREDGCLYLTRTRDLAEKLDFRLNEAGELEAVISG